MFFSFLGKIHGSLFDLVENFYKSFDDTSEPTRYSSENVKLQSEYVPDSFVAEVDNYWEFLKVVSRQNSQNVGNQAHLF